MLLLFMSRSAPSLPPCTSMYGVLEPLWVGRMTGAELPRSWSLESRLLNDVGVYESTIEVRFGLNSRMLSPQLLPPVLAL